MNKVYRGDEPIADHIKQLDMPDWIPHEERKQPSKDDKPRTHCIEVQRLLRESGLIKD